MDAAVMNPLENAMFMASYVRRKRWEAEQQAAAIWKLLGDAMSNKGGTAGRSAVPVQGKPKQMSGMKLLHAIGVEA